MLLEAQLAALLVSVDANTLALKALTEKMGGKTPDAAPAGKTKATPPASEEKKAPPASEEKKAEPKATTYEDVKKAFLAVIQRDQNSKKALEIIGAASLKELAGRPELFAGLLEKLNAELNKGA